MLYFYLKTHQNAFGGRTSPRPAGGAYSAPPIKGGGEGGTGRGREGKGRRKKEEWPPMSEVTPCK